MAEISIKLGKIRSLFSFFSEMRMMELPSFSELHPSLLIEISSAVI